MGLTDVDTLKGKIELETSPSNLCWGKPIDFVKKLTDILTVKFPVSLNNQFTVVGSETPSLDDKGKMWARFTKSRNWLGWHAFIKGQWRRVYEYLPSEIIWTVGDSRSIPDGFQLVEPGVPLPADVIVKITSEYVPITSASPAAFSYFAMRFIGY